MKSSLENPSNQPIQALTTQISVALEHMQPMNQRIITSNLGEASEELSALIDRFLSKEPPTSEELSVTIAHIYHHLNVAWNAREASDAAYQDLTEEQFERWRKFPTEMNL